LLIIHCGYGKGFFLWGERSFSGKSFRGKRRFKEGGARDHLFDPGAERIAAALSELGFEHSDLSRKEKLKLNLPTIEDKYPIPSTSMLGDLPKAHSDAPVATHAAWFVETLPVGITDMLELRDIFAARELASPDGRFLMNGVMAALDLCYVMECFGFSMSLLERGRFLPDIKVSGDGTKYEPLWSPMFIGDDATRHNRLESVAPDIIRTREGSGSLPLTFSLREICSDFIDGLVRLAWTKKGAADRDASSHRIAKAIIGNMRLAESSVREKKRRGKLVNALNPHALWIRSLGWLGETDGLSQSLASIYPEVKEWRDRYEWFEHAPFKLKLKLSGGENPDAWRLEYSLRRPGTREAITAKDVWNGGDCETSGIGAYMRRYLLLMLGRIGSLFRPVRDSLESDAPEWCALSRAEAADFLRNCAPELSGIGVEVIYPEWWNENSSDMLSIRGTRGITSPFKWEPAWHGVVLSDDEKRAIMFGESPLARIRGSWVFISPEHLEEITSHISGLPEELSPMDAVRLAVRDPFVDGFTGLPELESIYGALCRGVPLELLDAPVSMKGELRPYQRRGYSWLAFLSGLGIGACLADDMGLGKTVQALSMIQRYRDMGHHGPVLLVCPTSVIENWRLEILRFFPSMPFYVHHGHERLRGSKFAGEAKRKAMVLSSYSLLYRDADLYKGVDWLGVVLDEAQNIKNPDTRQSRSVRAIKSDWRIVLTGTPIENHVGDLWAIMEFLMPGMLGNRRQFTNKYVKPIVQAPDARLMDGLRRKISPLVMRRLKTDPDIAPDLPLKIQTHEYCGLKKEQIKLYSSVTEELAREIGHASGITRKGLVLVGLTRMKQICDHPSLFAKDGDYSCERSSKLERFISMAEEMFETGDRALVFTQYVEMGNILKYQLQEHFGKEVFFLHGGVPKDGRDRMVSAFQEGAGPQFFVLSLRAGGVGLNLTRANHVVMFDRWWNPAVETQAIDRAYRIGQTRNVQVHIFCCRGTLEERIDELISSKKEVANMVVESSDNWITELSDRELQRLLSLSPGVLES